MDLDGKAQGWNREGGRDNHAQGGTGKKDRHRQVGREWGHMQVKEKTRGRHREGESKQELQDTGNRGMQHGSVRKGLGQRGLASMRGVCNMSPRE